MAFQFKPKESVPKGICRMVRREIAKALAKLDGDSLQDDAIHEARKGFKKVRAALRLVRDDLGDHVYRDENTVFRDAGRPLTELRDAKVLLETLDQLRSHFASEIKGKRYAKVRDTLRANQQAIRAQVLEKSGAVQAVVQALQDARNRLRDWTISHKGWGALGSNLKRVYQRGQEALGTAAAEPTPEHLHEWRKQAKYLWHELQMLEPAWIEHMPKLADGVHDLTQILGDDHDLFVLHEKMRAAPDLYGDERTVQRLRTLIERRRRQLQKEAFERGRKIYQDRPRVFVNRLKADWKLWRAGTAAVR